MLEKELKPQTFCVVLLHEDQDGTVMHQVIGWHDSVKSALAQIDDEHKSGTNNIMMYNIFYNHNKGV